jgi:hypothetical protein
MKSEEPLQIFKNISGSSPYLVYGTMPKMELKYLARQSLYCRAGGRRIAASRARGQGEGEQGKMSSS